MVFYADEDDVWKCLNHPSRRRRIGVCAPCLREKLSVLCPDCAMVRPCACCSEASSSSSSSLSMISFPGDAAAFNRSASTSGVGSVGRVSNFIDTEPSFKRSRSVALPIFKSLKLSGTGSDDSGGKSKSRFWMFFWPRRLKRDKIPEDAEKEETVDLKIRAIARSKSVAASNTTFFAGRVIPEARSVKSKGWYFPSPMKVFRQSKPTVKIIHERSPLNRG